MYLIYLIDSVDQVEVQTCVESIDELGKLLRDLDTERYSVEGIQKENLVKDYREFLRKTPGLETGTKQ